MREENCKFLFYFPEIFGSSTRWEKYLRIIKIIIRTSILYFGYSEFKFTILSLRTFIQNYFVPYLLGKHYIVHSILKEDCSEQHLKTSYWALPSFQSSALFSQIWMLCLLCISPFLDF